MSNTTYDARVWAIKSRTGKRGTSYYVRWITANQEHRNSFKTKALADSFRSDLVAAQRRGERFDLESGLPASMQSQTTDIAWFEFACDYVDVKWPELAGNSRKGVAETLATVTPALLVSERGKPDVRVLRKALNGWAFHAERRDNVEQPRAVRQALSWLTENTRPVSSLADPAVLREVVQLISTRLDGKSAAASVVSRKRAVLHNALDYAVERGLLAENPLLGLKWKPPKTVQAIDKRTVVNPQQARRLLEAVGQQQPSGPRLKAFFAVLYYTAARPAEAVNLRRGDITLPELVWDAPTGEWTEPEGAWGELLLSESAPETGARWSTTGRRRDRRQLKHRGKGDTRVVPCPPPLVRILREHLHQFRPLENGRVFYSMRRTELSQSTYSHVWERARTTVLTDEQAASPLAKRPYDLRHAAVSGWLSAGVPAPQVAEWAGHSVQVLLQIYAKCLAGQEEAARTRVATFLAEG